ncbi:MAG TPA: hypothetical protein VFL98_02895 [Candidatus Paceibacterota bacterium]|nr:hypothetical protein [Candidatus Paceibacterota bacterium]
MRLVGLLAVLGCLMFATAAPASQMIATRNGVPDPHARGHNCVACHWHAPPVIIKGDEHCASCHLPATQGDVAASRMCRRFPCPWLFWDTDGKPYPFGNLNVVRR